MHRYCLGVEGTKMCRTWYQIFWGYAGMSAEDLILFHKPSLTIVILYSPQIRAQGSEQQCQSDGQSLDICQCWVSGMPGRCLSSIHFFFQFPSPLSSGDCFPDPQRAVLLGQSGALSCPAKGQAQDPSQASQTLSSENLNLKQSNSGEEVLGTDSS